MSLHLFESRKQTASYSGGDLKRFRKGSGIPGLVLRRSKPRVSVGIRERLRPFWKLRDFNLYAESVGNRHVRFWRSSWISFNLPAVLCNANSRRRRGTFVLRKCNHSVYRPLPRKIITASELGYDNKTGRQEVYHWQKCTYWYHHCNLDLSRRTLLPSELEMMMVLAAVRTIRGGKHGLMASCPGGKWYCWYVEVDISSTSHAIPTKRGMLTSTRGWKAGFRKVREDDQRWSARKKTFWA